MVAFSGRHRGPALDMHVIYKGGARQAVLGLGGFIMSCLGILHGLTRYGVRGANIFI
jgi:hypothetical protein